MANILRFAFVFLESAFRKLSDDSFSREKALIVIACAQVSAVFIISHAFVLAGATEVRLDFGFGVAILFGVAIVGLDYRIIKGSGELDAYRMAFRKMDVRRRVLGGVIVVAIVVTLVVANIVMASMVAGARET